MKDQSNQQQFVLRSLALYIPLPFRRLLAVSTAISLVLPNLAAAQDESGGAPPTRVGQISAVSGSVSFNSASAGSNGWAAASLNYPVSAGDSLYTQQGAQAAVALDASTITLAENTELQITGLNDTVFGATQSQGEVFLDIENLAPGTSYALATPRGTVNIAQDGKYDIAAGDQNSPTVVTVFAGAATVTDPGATVNVTAGQAAELTGTDQTVAQLEQAQPDAFAQQLLAVNEAPPPSYAPQVVGQMTGGYELAQYGSWDQDPDYGAVWYPQVDSGWAPYREGHWAYVQPWGYTWVDNEPWGFAPFHYGRWIDHGGRWGWIPADRGYGGDDRPVYAPAVVSFFGLGLAVGLTAAALSSHSIGWVPLGPGEAFRPYYRASDAYDQRINAHYVRDPGSINFRDDKAFAPDHFANRRAATYLAADAMGRGDPVSKFGHPVAPDMFAKARPVGGDVRLPERDARAAMARPAEAPHPTAFAERRDLPRATIAPPGAGGAVLERPALARPDASRPIGAVPPERPAFGGNPGYHPPPPPPGIGHPPQVFSQGGTDFHPQNGQRGDLPQVVHPGNQGLPNARPLAPQHQQLPQVVHPENQGMPNGRPLEPQHQQLPQVYHPQAAQTYHPPVENRPAVQPQFHPQPQMQQPHFNPPPQPRPEITPQPRPEITPQPRPEMAPQPRPEMAPQPRPESPHPAPPAHDNKHPQNQ
jgi:hypothetical protein